MTRPWGCPKCKHLDSFVRDTSRDEENYIVRLRKCTQCGTTWSTEERPLEPSAYWGRALSRNAARAARYYRVPRICAKCGQPYPAGQYMRHVARSKVHLAALKPANRDRLRARRYKREWERRKRHRKEAA